MSLPFPPLRPFSAGDVWAQSATDASAFDARAISDVGIPEPVLMENAGRAAALVLARLYSASTVVGIVGSGNNGGDALVALRTLKSWGYDVRAILVAERDPADPLLHGWSLDVVSDSSLADEGWRTALTAADVVIDGVFGTGARGAPRARQAQGIGRMNESARPVLALDVPSGIDASNGAVPGGAVQASVTVSFGAPKLGALLHPARAYVGRHVTVEIGLPPLAPGEATARVVTPEWARAQRPLRGTDTHKNKVGRVLIVGGRPGMAGAVILAARAAFRAGAGLVRVSSPRGSREAIQAALPEAIHVDDGDRDALDEAIANSDAIAVGPGLGTAEEARATLRHVCAAGSTPIVLDADALNLVAAGAVDLLELGGSRSLLITPHPGEMARLLAEDDSDRTRVETVNEASARFGCAVLFKGAPSLVAAPGRLLAVDTQGSSDLAVAGLGDTLTGVCVALLAQGLDAPSAASLGLYLAGRAARLAGRGAGLMPSDVARWLPEALTESGVSTTDLDLPFVSFDADPVY